MSIEFKNVSYIYSPKSPFAAVGLKNASFSFKKGSFSMIVGKTGSGKSTIAQLSNALLSPSEGEVHVDTLINANKIKKRKKTIRAIRKKVGLVFQFPEYQLFEESVEKDVAFGPRNFGLSKEEALKKAHDSLKQIGLDESFYKRSPFELSGGEKRKVALAGILAIEPEILIVDEPTSGLDPFSAKEVMKIFKKINETGVTIIVITHDMNLVLEYADNVLLVNDGKIILESTPSELFSKDMEEYSLNNPLVIDFANSLKKRGFAIDISKIRNVNDLALAIKNGRKR